MRENRSLPRARKDGLIEERVDEELLLYDQDSHAAHCLSPVAARLWRRCDGEHDLAELAELVGASESLVADALHELREKDLLEAEPVLMQDTVPGESRREAIARAARYGGAATVGSLIVSATAATPAMASSGEIIQKCVAKAGEKKSCCECTMPTNCISNSVITSKMTCEEECKKLGSKFALWASEGLCM